MPSRIIDKKTRLLIGLILVGILFSSQLFILQVIDTKYKISATNNALRYETSYPSRGLMLDRNQKILVGNKIAYDIMVTPADLKNFDTLEFSNIFNIPILELKDIFKNIKKNRRKIGYQSVPILKRVSNEDYNKFAEKGYKYSGINGVSRSIREYPYNASGNLLGYVSEVDASYIRKNPEYKSRDFAGKTGIEMICENILKGEKGYNIFLRDVHNRIQSRFEDGNHDLSAIPGKNVVTTIDAELQHYIEELMANKMGSVVAIEPSTGEILSLVSSPGIGVDKLANISKYYSEIVNDPQKPMYNRAIMSPCPPGSVFKMLNGLIALQDSCITENTRYRCNHGYHAGNLTVGCHRHSPNVNLRQSIQTSCNAYYCHIFRSILDNPKWESIDKALDHWKGIVESFGFGSPLGIDLPSEQGGSIPSSETYNKIYRKGGWRSLTIVSLSIGQGELATTPLQLANYASILANRGYYYIPHILKDSKEVTIDLKYKERQYTKIDTALFKTVIPGMYDAVNSAPGEGGTAWRAAAKGLDICGKTGTAENPHGEDHAIFIGFAPRENPKIAIAVYIENAGFGGTWAAPLGSLAIEKYLNREVKRGKMEKDIKESILNPYLLETQKEDND